MVYAMITSPVINASLVGTRVAKHKEKSKNKMGFIRSMRPKSVHSDRDSKTTERRNKQNGLVRIFMGVDRKNSIQARTMAMRIIPDWPEAKGPK